MSYIAVLLAACVGVLACATTTDSQLQNTTGNPNANDLNTQRIENMPYCPGGNRGKKCLLGEVCQGTERGCQVCQCRSLED